MRLRRVLRRRLVRASIETEVLRRVLRREGCYRRRLEGRNTPFRRVRPPSRVPYLGGSGESAEHACDLAYDQRVASDCSGRA